MARGLGASIERTPSGAHFSTIRSGSCDSDITGSLTEAPCAEYRELREIKSLLLGSLIIRKARNIKRNRDINYLMVVDTLT
jgi:hypothetical protein